MDLSIVIPCYNEAKNLSGLIAGYREALRGKSGVEVILVDNGSTDSSSEVLRRELMKSENGAFRTTKVEVNQGYGFGILHGLRQGKGKFLAWSHADGQCPPADVFRVLQEMEKTGHPETCFGKGFRITERGTASSTTAAHAKFATLVLGQKMEEINAQPKVFAREFLQEFASAPHGLELDTFAYYKALKTGLRVVTVQVEFKERTFGESSWALTRWSRLSTRLKSLSYLLRLRLIG